MVRTLLVINTRFYRESLATTLPQKGSVSIVGSVSGKAEAFACASRVKPDVVLLDAAVAEGPELVRALTMSSSPAQVVVAAISETPDSVINWAEAGIAGYVSRDHSVDELIRIIECVAQGELMCPPRIAASILGRLSQLATLGRSEQPESGCPPRLTSREKEVIRLVASGLSNKRIASELGISVATAKNHVHNVLSKLNLRRRADAATALDSGTPLLDR
jgi:DNA-binding NarL/FixJ family response regulator